MRLCVKTISGLFFGCSLSFCSLRALAVEKQFTDIDRKHWAFQPIAHPEPPPLSSSWGRNTIDAFISQKLQQKHLHPAAPADKATLLRRATFDLLGLPPMATEVE